MARNKYQNIVQAQASNLDKAVGFLKATLGDLPWLRNLSEAASDIRANCKGDDWSVQIRDMEMPIENPKHLKPRIMEGNLKMFVSITMEGRGKEWKEGEDCIKSLYFKVEVLERNQGDPQRYFQTGFHIDRMDDNDDPSEMHPLYHIHFLNDSQIGGTEVLSMDVPRLMHHPVDVLLGVLLVYANYNKSGYDKLKSDGHFMALCRDSAKHILGPYYQSLSKVPWDAGFVTDYDKTLCPYLIA